MTTIKFERTDNPVTFHYSVDGFKVEPEIYAGSTMLLSALNQYIKRNGRDKTKWEYMKQTNAGNAQTSYLGRDGQYYKLPQPVFIYERQEDGEDPVMGGMRYKFVRIQLELEANLTDEEIWVSTSMGGYETMETWKLREKYTAQPDSTVSNIVGLKETLTGFSIAITKLPLVLAATGEPLNATNPSEIALFFQLVYTHFHGRIDRIASIDDAGQFQF